MLSVNLAEPGEPEVLIPAATSRIANCVGAVAEWNNADARWVAKVLNQYGHLVQHEGDVT